MENKVDHFSDGRFSDEKGNIFRVRRVADFAHENRHKYFVPKFDLSKIENKLDWWEEKYFVHDQREFLKNLSRMVNCDTSFPIIVLLEDEGTLSVADGLNRLLKAVSVEKKKYLPAYFIPKRDIMHFNERDIPSDFSEMKKLSNYLAKYLGLELGVKSIDLKLSDIDWSFRRMGMNSTLEQKLDYFDLVKSCLENNLNESFRINKKNEKTIGTS